MNRRLFWSILTMSLFLMACSTPSTTSPAQIIGTTEWHLTQLNGTAIITPVVTLQLTDTTIGGQGFCNSYHGPLTIDGNTIKFDNIASTRRICVEDGVMQQEQAYFAALNEVATMSVDGTTLTLSNATGTTVLVYTEK